MAYDDALGREVSPIASYTVGARCIYPYYDFFATRPLVKAGEMTWGRWVAEVIPALQPVGCWDDPMPGLVGLSKVVSTAAGNRLRTEQPKTMRDCRQAQ